nr:hypothetical protein Iba_chr01aCG17090 [Ipomoea batatas]
MTCSDSPLWEIMKSSLSGCDIDSLYFNRSLPSYSKVLQQGVEFLKDLAPINPTAIKAEISNRTHSISSGVRWRSGGGTLSRTAEGRGRGRALAVAIGGGPRPRAVQGRGGSGGVRRAVAVRMAVAVAEGVAVPDLLAVAECEGRWQSAEGGGGWTLQICSSRRASLVE